jgi:hypothetical protein
MSASFVQSIAKAQREMAGYLAASALPDAHAE